MFLCRKALRNTSNYATNQNYPLVNRLANFILLSADGDIYNRKHTEVAEYSVSATVTCFMCLPFYVKPIFCSIWTKKTYRIKDFSSLQQWLLMRTVYDKCLVLKKGFISLQILNTLLVKHSLFSVSNYQGTVYTSFIQPIMTVYPAIFSVLQSSHEKRDHSHSDSCLKAEQQAFDLSGNLSAYRRFL